MTRKAGYCFCALQAQNKEAQESTTVGTIIFIANPDSHPVYPKSLSVDDEFGILDLFCKSKLCGKEVYPLQGQNAVTWITVPRLSRE